MALTIGFYLLAFVTIGAGLAVVILKDVFRSALALVLGLVAVAGIYITLNADFLAGAQILVYVGAISILLILGIMLTREVQQGSPANKYKIPSFLVSIVFFGIMCFVILQSPWKESTVLSTEPTTAKLATTLFSGNGYILPVEIAGVLLLAAIIGAIVMAKEK
ncbi:MAG: NADH-quinone oxidoreductase subunit J [Dehalococcoidales bacterium]|nr:NADH-quinone oxidoreductase subunit J [Dehalococcoidales bacterium]